MVYFMGILIGKIKKQEYKLDPSIKLINLFLITYGRIISLIRGILKCIGLRKCGKYLFVGKHVKLLHRNYIELGTGVTIDDHVVLDALSKDGLIVGNNVRIGSFSQIKCTGILKNIGKGIKIGSNSSIGEFSFIGAAGGITIGDHVIMGQNVRFHSENHNYDRMDIPIMYQGVSNKGISVDNDCWIGSGVVFLDGVKVGRGCVIGANTLVNKDIPDNSIAMGNPVKVVGTRN